MVLLGSLTACVMLCIRRQRLILELARRDVHERFVGQALGVLWAVGMPMIMTLVYIFVFAVVLRARLSASSSEGRMDYVIYLLSGLIPWLAFQEGVSRSATSVVSQSSLVKQVVFPVEVLPIKVVVASLLSQFVSTAALLVVLVLSKGSIPWTIILWPLGLLMQLGMTLGLAFVISAVSVYLRDLKDIVQLLLFVGVYLSPAFYPPDAVPQLFRPFLAINPFSALAWVFQDIFYNGKIVSFGAWAAAATMATIFPAFGYAIFRKLRPHFGNLL
jgi:lipopolysaccharide transport system permease protein